MINKIQNKKQFISPISLPENSELQRFDFQNFYKLNIEQINRNLNSSQSPKHLQSNSNRFKQYLNSYKTQIPSNTNQFVMFSPQTHQLPKTQNTNLNYQKEHNPFQLKNNILKIENSTQQQSSFEQNQQLRINKQLIHQNQKNNTLDEAKLKSDSDSEEEVSIWEDYQLKTSGIDTDQFVDCRGEQLDFYQIYRLRSALYQQTYVSRLDTIQEVQILSQHFNKGISMEQLLQQQSYLDKYYDIQKKDSRKFNQNKLSLNKNLKDFSQKCQTERTKSSYQKNEITSPTLKQQTNKSKISNKMNQIQKQQLENYKEKIENDLQTKEHKNQVNQQNKEESKQFQLSQQQQKNQYKSKRRQKISIDQEEAKKFIQKKIIPIKQISLDDDDDKDKDNHESPKNNYSCNTSQISNQSLNISKWYTYNTNVSKIDQSEINSKLESEQIIQNASQPEKSVLSYLKKIVSSQINFRNQKQQNTKLDYQINKSMDQSSSKKKQFVKQQN